jgi:RNA-directed DNA polymerase
MVFTTLAHLMDLGCLREAYRRTRKDAAPGSDGVTAAAYAEHLEANLTDLYERLRSGRYTAPPVKRTWLDKEDGSQRPIRDAGLRGQHRPAGGDDAVGVV